MPAKSQAQLRWIFSNLGKKEGMKWARDTPDIKGLPEYASKTPNIDKLFGRRK